MRSSAALMAAWRAGRAARGMPGGAAVDDRVLDVGGELQQADCVGDGRAAAADAAADLLLGEREALDQHLVGGGLFQRVEVGALHVLDQGPLEQLLGRSLAHDDGHFVQLGDLGGAPAPFACNQPVLAGLIAAVGDDQRLQDAVLANGGG